VRHLATDALTRSTTVSFDYSLRCWSRIVHVLLPSDSRNHVDYYSISLHSVNAIFTGAITIYEVSAKHYQCLFESLSFESCV